MKVMAQVGMVMNLDKCIGCHTCSVTCKQAWTNRDGMEYAWFNNVETRPGLGYPRTYQDQDKWKGGWELNRRGKLVLKQGGRTKRLLSIFSNPVLPEVSDYYEPWTYDYDTLLNSPPTEHTPVATPHSAISGEPMAIRWSANWDDDLGGAAEYGPQDPVIKKIKDHVTDRVKFEFEQAFMFYLPRICEHCLNPACVASCPSGAMYKRSEDGIVLVDQDACRGWRMCVTGCPYKKVYFNHNTGKAEKCTLCYPRIEAGQPTVCSETCVGRLRYLGLFLYDADRVAAAAATPNEKDLYEAQARPHPRPERPCGAGPGPQGRHRRGLDCRRDQVARVQVGEGVPGGAAVPPGIPHHADGLVHPPAVAHRRCAARDGARCRGRRQPLWGAAIIAHPGRVPRGTVHGRRRRTRVAQPRHPLGHAFLHA
ncbi:hypothetical protein GCM10025876_04570 [Demequina litorisediminis]|uniref:4Fe-4S ferredoxin-type domain-containing protein n=1 Tax=Demequina litorisediminis TaxID=1849022 RepID=A0ABQ6I8T9_9MICO|nr:hypothetical protein GCM10025876_04570 [Demequina litorisediminis]